MRSEIDENKKWCKQLKEENVSMKNLEKSITKENISALKMNGVKGTSNVIKKKTNKGK